MRKSEKMLSELLKEQAQKMREDRKKERLFCGQMRMYLRIPEKGFSFWPEDFALMEIHEPLPKTVKLNPHYTGQGKWVENAVVEAEEYLKACDWINEYCNPDVK